MECEVHLGDFCNYKMSKDSKFNTDIEELDLELCGDISSIGAYNCEENKGNFISHPVTIQKAHVTDILPPQSVLEESSTVIMQFKDPMGSLVVVVEKSKASRS